MRIHKDPTAEDIGGILFTISSGQATTKLFFLRKKRGKYLLEANFRYDAFFLILDQGNKWGFSISFSGMEYSEESFLRIVILLNSFKIKRVLKGTLRKFRLFDPTKYSANVLIGQNIHGGH